jgi:hypothetical protein
MAAMRQFGRSRLGVAALALTAAALCAIGVAAAASGSAKPPRPARILVVDFATTPAKVKLQRGVGSRLMKVFGGSAAAKKEQSKDAADVVDAIGDTLVKEIEALGIPAERVAPGAVPASASQPIAIINGRVLQIDEGNRTTRTVIGFGAGASRVKADAELSYQVPGSKPEVLISYADTGKSRRTPGLGVGKVAGAAETATAVSAGLHAYSEVHGATVGDDAKRLGEDLGRQLKQSFAALGWIR